MHGIVSCWIITDKPFWQTCLAFYGASTLELFCIYFGFLSLRLFGEKAIGWLRKKLRKGMEVPFADDELLTLKKKTGYQALHSFTKKKKQGLIAWLVKQNMVIIAILFFFPVFDMASTAALGAKKLKYGHWYLAAANLIRIVITVGLMTLAIEFGIEFLKRLFL